jgi:hypothetical protein
MSQRHRQVTTASAQQVNRELRPAGSADRRRFEARAVVVREVLLELAEQPLREDEAHEVRHDRVGERLDAKDVKRDGRRRAARGELVAAGRRGEPVN